MHRYIIIIIYVYIYTLRFMHAFHACMRAYRGLSKRDLYAHACVRVSIVVQLSRRRKLLILSSVCVGRTFDGSSLW